MKKRIFSLLLITVMLLAVSLSFFGCEKEEESSQVGEESIEDNSFYGLTLPDDIDYNGKTVRVLTTATAQSETCFQIQPEDNSMYSADTASAVINTCAECTRLVEERLNIEIEEEVIYTFSRYGGEMYKRIYQDAMAFTCDYLFTMPCLIEGAMLATDGLLYDLNTVPNINLNNEWWCKPFNDTVTIAGATYFATNDIGYTSKNATLFVAFNKQMADSYRLTEKYGYNTLYEMVDDKAWTQDVMFEMAKSVYQDLNGNNKCDVGDINGFAGQNSAIYWMLVSGGEGITENDDNGYPVLSVKNERAISIIEAAQDYFLDPQSGFISADDYFGESNVPVSDVIIPEFKADRCLFFMDGLMNLSLLRDMPNDFGVLPPPMFDEDQEYYSSNIGAWSANCICIPTAIVGEDLELAGYVIEALAAVSKAKLNPVYYEQTLQYQISRDDDSMRMLDIIFANRTPELAEVFRWGTMSDVVSKMINSPKGSFISKYEAAEAATNNAIQETIDEFEKRKE